MGRKKEYPPIRVEAYAPIDGKLVNTKDMTPEQKRWLATRLSIQILTAAFPGYRFEEVKENANENTML